MVTVKRKRKRSLASPAGRYRTLVVLALSAVMIALCVFGLVGRYRGEERMDDLTEYMAKAIRTDLNQALQAYDTLGRRSGDMAGDALENMKRYMYAAYRMNQSLVVARGETYSIIDTATYNNFQTLAGEYERLLANGQSTATVKTSLGDYMTALADTLSIRFDNADYLLPQTVSKQPGR